MTNKTTGVSAEARKLIGQAIIDGLLVPTKGGIAVPLDDYEQGEGGYWQGAGSVHKQTKGDYHQAVKEMTI
jgi:hypothetical protein